MNHSLEYWKSLLQKQLASASTETETAYITRILRVLEMPNLTTIHNHPIERIARAIQDCPFFADFEFTPVPEIVREYETFDLFHFSKEHVARRPSDSYFIQKSENTEESYLLRPHTSILWHYALNEANKAKLESTGKLGVLTWGKVYRVDELDTTHHECFHQIDALYLERSDIPMTQDVLKSVLKATIEALFGPQVTIRFNADSFPYTIESLEAEVEYDNRWIEVLGSGVVHPNVLETLGIDSKKYTGWAFGFGIERLAMVMKKVPDIRLFWSQDPRITEQWETNLPFKSISQFPPVIKDISMIVPRNSFLLDEEERKKSGELELTRNTECDFFAITSCIRDICDNLVESVKIIDIYDSPEKFGENHKSLTLRILFRSPERTLTNEEINTLYFQIRETIPRVLGHEVR